MIRTFALVMVSMIGSCAVVQAQSDEATSFPVLGLAPSARAAALGGAFSAVYGDDVNTLFYNPALLNSQMHGVLSVSYLNHLSDIKAGFVAYSRDMGRLGTFGAGLRYISYGSFERADENGARDGSTFGAGDAVLTVGWARAYSERVRYGINLNALFSSIDQYSARALGADAGIVFHLPDRLWTFSASMHNVGFVTSSFGETDEALPLDVRVGIAKQLTHLPLLISLMGYELNQLGDQEDAFVSDLFQHLNLGAELQFGAAFNLRIGYNHRRHEHLKTNSRLDLAGVGLGFGLKINRFRFDYAFNSWSALGKLHHLSVRTML